jgi:GNAT superfamily N-acetyltransferase
MARKLARLTLDNLVDLPIACQSCVFWELDAVRRGRAEASCDARSEKEAWLSRVLLEWGSCGRIAYVDGDPAGYVLYAPPSYLPGADVFPTAPVSEDAVLLATAWVYPEYSGAGLGRVLMQSVVKDLLKRGDIRALEAFGDTRKRPPGGCVLPADYLINLGFKTHRAHPRHPRMRMELKSVLTWREEVEAALERLVGAVRPHSVSPATERGRARRGVGRAVRPNRGGAPRGAH